MFNLTDLSEYESAADENGEIDVSILSALCNEYINFYNLGSDLI